MALRAAHGTGADALMRVEVLPPNEQPAPVPDDRDPLSGLDRRQDGTLATTEAARALGRRGGQAKAKRVRLARSLGLAGIDHESEAFAPYRRAASSYRRHHCRELARLAGGEVGAGPSSIVASAAWQLAASRFLFDQASRTGDPATFKTASQLANDARQNLLASYELAVREGEARARTSAPRDLRTRILGCGS